MDDPAPATIAHEAIDWRDHPTTAQAMGLPNGSAAAADYAEAHLRFFARAVREFMA